MMRVTAGSLNATILAMNKTVVTERQAAKEALQAAGHVWRMAITTNASRSDMSLWQLEAAGHPFAKRHPKIMGSRIGSMWVRKPYMVHRRSGGFLNSIRGKLTNTSGGKPAYEVRIQATQKYQEYVITGTKTKMHSRNLLWDTGMQKDVQKKMKVAIIRVLGKKLRTQAVVRF